MSRVACLGTGSPCCDPEATQVQRVNTVCRASRMNDTFFVGRDMLSRMDWLRLAKTRSLQGPDIGSVYIFAVFFNKRDVWPVCIFTEEGVC